MAAFGLFLPYHKIKSQNTSTKKDTSAQKEISIQKYLKQQSNNSFIHKKLYEWLVVSKDSNISKNEIFAALEKENEKYTNKIIRSIKIKQISPFAKSILDTIGISTSKVGKHLDDLRFETKPSIIKSNLTFKRGEFVNMRKLKDSERILRSLNFITDALIIVEPAIIDTSLVNVLVITQDSYPYGVRLSISGNNAQFGLYSKNALGYGLEVEHKINTQKTEDGRIGLYEHLRWENIYGSFITLDTEFNNTYNSNSQSIGAQKDFFIPEIKYAGGFKISKNFKINHLNKSTGNEYLNNHDHLIQDYWIGRSYLINAENFFNRSNLTILGQTMFSDYYNMVDTLMEFPHYKPNFSIFGSVAFSKRDFYKNQLIYNYGRTEDVPYGFLGSLSFGYNQNDQKNRYYSAAHFSFGKTLIPNKGYLYISSDIQSFFHKGQPEDSRIKLQAKFISSLNRIGVHRLRSFLSASYVNGYHNSYPNYIYINQSNNGLRGYSSHLLKGTQKIVFSNENILFSSKELLGFKMAFFSFFDMAWISNRSKYFNNKPFYSIGGGFRIRNDHLVFNTIQVQLAYFPRIPTDGKEFAHRLTSEQTNSFNQFAPQKPYVDIYK
ncbi:BamA/TamA family outer membrane protein [Saccharicrinis fermentans]|uniref:hypothetical protein n=1 Tax=Saccharicrinis fermentans TaxID=982 RepID=UPI001268B224|nr:hypothetical protein [Saccharicrinis fermentans]